MHCLLHNSCNKHAIARWKHAEMNQSRRLPGGYHALRVEATATHLMAFAEIYQNQATTIHLWAFAEINHLIIKTPTWWIICPESERNTTHLWAFAHLSLAHPCQGHFLVTHHGDHQSVLRITCTVMIGQDDKQVQPGA